MIIKKILEFIRTKNKLARLMVEVNETMDLRDSAETFAKYVCKMHGWEPRWFGDYTNHFCAVESAFMDGYIKSMHDNGFEFRNGLVKKRDILEEMPCGALDYYRKDAIDDTKTKAIEVLRVVMNKYETSQQNINVIMNAFEKMIKED